MMQKGYTENYSEILNMFYGIHVSTLTCVESGKSNDEYLSIRPEPFMVISLPIPAAPPSHSDHISLTDCFDLNCESELMEGENAWFNETLGKKQNVYKRLAYWSLPEIMVIDIKRFEYNYKTDSFVKNQQNQHDKH